MNNIVTLPNGTKVKEDFLLRIAQGFMTNADFEKLRKIADGSPYDACYILFEWAPEEDR